MATTRFEEGDGSIERARRLRRDSTPAETKLWSVLRGSRLGGWEFRRQQRFGPYCADFIGHAARLVVEVDGDSHAGHEDHDVRRAAYIQAAGYSVLRFGNTDVMSNLAGIFDVIASRLGDAPSPSHSAAPSGPLPLPQGERGR